jgi:serpin B
MHASHLTRRRFFTLAGAAMGGLMARNDAIGRLASENRPSEPHDPIDDARELATPIRVFAMDLYADIGKTNKGSLFFSPFSISTALAMTSLGARGKTLQEIQKVLHLPEDAPARYRALLTLINDKTRSGNRGYELTAANALWAMKGYPWRMEFLDLAQKNYGAGILETDFHMPETARQQINSWVEKETHEKIKDLISEGDINAATRLVLTSAVYFKGDWDSKFNEKLTKNAAFTRMDGSKAEVPLMLQEGEFHYGELTVSIDRKQHRIQVLELPYARNDLSMRIYLPADSSVIDGLPQPIAKGELGEDSLKMRKVQVFLPRFKTESEFSLAAALKNLGMNAAFGDADFTGMSSGSERLFISDVVHKAYVDVNETGTEAAAATGVIVRAASAPMVVVFRADRAFLFSIRDNRTCVTLFMGRYNGPG